MKKFLVSLLAIILIGGPAVALEHPLSAIYNLLQGGNYQAAEEQLQKYPADESSRKYVNYLRGVALLGQKRYLEAIPLLEESRTSLPEDPGPALAELRARRLAGQYDAAWKLINHLHVSYPGNSSVASEEVALYLDNGLYLAALNASSALPDDTSRRELQIKLLLQIGRGEEALSEAQAHYLEQHGTPASRLLLAQCLNAQNMPAAAAGHLEILFWQGQYGLAPTISALWLKAGQIYQSEFFQKLAQILAK